MTLEEARLWWVKVRQKAKRTPKATEPGKTARPSLLSAGRPEQFGVIRPLARPQENETPARDAACSALASNFRDGNDHGQPRARVARNKVALDNK